MYGSNCKGAEEEGVSILHGNRGVYHDDKQPAFKVVYDAVRDVGILLTQNGIALLTIPDYLRQEPAEMFSFACLYDTIFCFLSIKNDDGNINKRISQMWDKRFRLGVNRSLHSRHFDPL